MDRKVVRASYERCLDATARLAAFATSKPLKKAYEVNERQDNLAVDDLVSFCVHTRRLIDNVGTYSKANSLFIKSSQKEPLSFWKILGSLIHHDELEILRCETRVRMLQAFADSKTEDEYWSRIRPELEKGTYSEPCPPIILFKSDKLPRTIIELEEFLQVFVQQILPEVLNKTAAEGLNLDDALSDDVVLSEKAHQILSEMRTEK